MARRKSRQSRREPYRDDMRYAMRGITDTTQMAMTGVVGIGMLGMVGSMFKK